MAYRLSLFIVVTLLGATPAPAGSLHTTTPERVGMSSGMLQQLDDKLQQLVADENSAGFQVVIARRGKVVFQKSFGVADKDTGHAITDDTLFRIYSMTKPLVGVAMMILYEEGKFSLSDPAAQYIPAFEGARVFVGEDDAGQMILEDAVRPPSMHDLLQHTAGLSYGVFSDTPVDRMYREILFADLDVSLGTFVATLAGIPLLYQPGTRYYYSLSADVQGYLIQRLSGMDPESFIRSRILEPLGMDETMAWVPPDKAARLSKVHTHNDEGALVVYQDAADSLISVDDAYRQPALFSGGSQLISTADDYWRFAQMLLNGGSLDGQRILSPGTVKMMTSNRLPESIPGRRIAPGWGHGFDLSVVVDHTLINYPVSDGEFSHGGLATTHFWVDPKQQLVVVFLSQYLPTSNRPYVDLMHRMVHAAVVD
jgi:CubicO group peptidase (beta-lactamase class C family)